MAGELQSLVIRDNTPLDVKSGIGVNGDGWVATCVLSGITNTSGTLDGSKLVIVVSDPGYLANGATTTVERTIYGTTFLRRSHPDSTGRQIATDSGNLTLQIALSDKVWAGTTIVSAQILDGFYTGSTASTAGSSANNATRGYNKPLSAWINFNGVTCVGNSLDVELSVAHESARNSQQVACVEFYVTDGVNTSSSQFSNEPVLSAIQTKGNIAEVFSATLDMSTQTQGAFSKVNAKVYPWIGDSSSVLDLDVDGYAQPTPMPLTTLKIFCDRLGTYSAAYAYVDGIGAGSPAVSASPATARANPFSTLALAATAVRAWNNTNKSRNDLGGATIRLMNDAATEKEYSITAGIVNAPGLGVMTVELDPLASGSVTYLSTTQTQHPANIIYRNIRFEGVAGGSGYILLGPASSGTPANRLFIDNCTFDNSENKNCISWHSYVYMRDVTFTGSQQFKIQNSATADRALASVVGCVADNYIAQPRYDTNPFCAIGCVMKGYNLTYPSYTITGYDGAYYYNNMFATAVFAISGTTTISRGLVNCQNIYEKLPENTSSVVCMNAFADGDLTSVENYIDFHNTAVGERSSRMYNDNASTKVAPSGIIKRGVSKHSIYDNYNTKGDTFNLFNGDGCVGAWEYQYGVGCSGNVSLFGMVGRVAGRYPINDGSQDWYLGNHWLDSSEPNLFKPENGYTQANIMDMFVDYTTHPLPSAYSGGDYALVDYPSPLTDRVALGEGLYKYDISGALRKNDGTGAAGAHEYSLSVPELIVGGGNVEFAGNSINVSFLPASFSVGVGNVEFVGNSISLEILSPPSLFTIANGDVEFSGNSISLEILGAPSEFIIGGGSVEFTGNLISTDFLPSSFIIGNGSVDFVGNSINLALLPPPFVIGSGSVEFVGNSILFSEASGPVEFTIGGGAVEFSPNNILIDYNDRVFITNYTVAWV